MISVRTTVISNELGESIPVSLCFDGNAESGTLSVGGVAYHFERIPKDKFIAEYKVDQDPDYSPQTDADGCCYILAPFSA